MDTTKTYRMARTRSVGLKITLALVMISFIITLPTAFGSMPSWKKKDRMMRIVYGGGLMGNIEPCGWSENQAGGLSRRKTLIDQIVGKLNHDEAVIVNAGNNFDMKSNDRYIASRYIISALAKSGIEVIGAGEAEVLFGASALAKLTDQTDIPIVAANVNGFAPYAVLKKNMGRTNVLITSVIDPELINHDHLAKINIGDPSEALHQLQNKVDHDLFIVIVHATKGRIADIIGDCDKIDLVIDGLSESLEPYYPKGDSVPVVSSNQKGMFVSYVDWYDKRTSVQQFSVPENLRADVGRVGQDPRIVSLVNAYEQEKQSHFNNLQAMGNKLNNPSEAMRPYLGSAACQTCHVSVSENWLKSRHARAISSLAKKSKESDPNCLACHVTTMNDAPHNGSSMGNNDKLWMENVQCEACHGPGADHAEKPLIAKMRPISKNTCTACHTSTADPDFNYEAAVKKSCS